MKTICTLRNMIRRNVEFNPQKIALIQGDRRYTFGQLSRRTGGMSNALLTLGLEKGDRVAILGPNSIENAEAYFSIPNAGLVLVMLNFRLAAPEILNILKDATPRAVMVHAAYRKTVAEIADRLGFVDHFIFIGDRAETPAGWHHYETLIEGASGGDPPVVVTEDDLAALMYTSGTTGSPKGCMATHRNFYHAGRSLTLELKMDDSDVGIIASPLFHATGEVTLMNDVYSGTTSVIMTHWDTRLFLELVQEHRITTGMLATPMLLFLVDYPEADRYDTGSLKKIFFAGAPVTPVVYERAVKRFGNVFIHLFGTTETVGQTTILKTEDIARALASGNTEILASCGRSFADMESVVVDENDVPVAPGVVGEMKVRGLGTTLGYWQKEAETSQVYRNGWYYPLDLCRVDEKGYIYVVDRKKDMIITGGENVYPAEVENALYKHPDIAQAAVVGLPDSRWGECVAAIVVPRPGKTLKTESVRDFCRKEIAGYKVPKQVIFTDSLPMSASGKILKYQLRARFGKA
ncbi:MAG: AMP-binding protein [Deltaproteobacteria bacterium]|nr:AMP-binding protein [Deltaproteobacteria bacterium]